MKRSTWFQLSAIFVHRRFALACAVLLSLKALPAVAPARASSYQDIPGQPGEPYPNMPGIAPLGVRIGKHLPVPESAKGPAIDPAKGYRVQDLGQGLYMVTDNGYQSMFMV